MFSTCSDQHYNYKLVVWAAEHCYTVRYSLLNLSAMSSKACKDLKAIADRSNRHVVYIQPEMRPNWQDSYDSELMQATQKALNAGVDPEKVYRLIESIASVDLDELPQKYLAACVEGGLSPDTDICGETLLHVLLNHPYPPPIKLPLDNIEVPAGAAALLQQQWSGRNPACGSVTLNELLSRKATPNREDTAGNTALHMVVACMVQRVHFPDPKLPDKQGSADEEVIQEGSMGAAPDAAAVEAQRQAAEQTAAQAAAYDDLPQDLEDNDAARAAYAEVGFKMLLAAGWSPVWRNHNSYTVANLIEAGLAKYQSELYDLRDPQGVAQTTVTLLTDKAPDKKLQEFLQHKIAGVEAVVASLQVMHGLAATAEMPRKARSAASLIALWLILLAAAMYWMISRQQS